MLNLKTNEPKCTSNWKHHVEKLIISSELEHSLQTMYLWRIKLNDKKIIFTH